MPGAWNSPKAGLVSWPVFGGQCQSPREAWACSPGYRTACLTRLFSSYNLAQSFWSAEGAQRPKTEFKPTVQRAQMFSYMSLNLRLAEAVPVPSRHRSECLASTMKTSREKEPPPHIQPPSAERVQGPLGEELLKSPLPLGRRRSLPSLPIDATSTNPGRAYIFLCPVSKSHLLF